MAGKGITMTAELRAYLVGHSDPPRSDVHRRLVDRTSELLGDLAIMQVAEEQGPWLTFTARLLRARRAVEVGTFTGYSALCIAEGLGPDGHLDCLDIESDYVDIGRPFWVEAGVADRIDVTIGPALDSLRDLPGGEWIDLAFIDADKENYAAYYEELLARLVPGGLIVADNALWSGAVVDSDPWKPDMSLGAILAFNDKVVSDDRVDALTCERRRRVDARGEAHGVRRRGGHIMTIEMIPDLPEHVVGFVARGEVTKEDYTEVLEPAITDALGSTDKINLLYVLGGEFTGYSGGAMWEDGKVGTRYLSHWERIAVVSDTKWVRDTVGVFGHLLPGRIKVFSLDEEPAARTWVSG